MYHTKIIPGPREIDTKAIVKIIGIKILVHRIDQEQERQDNFPQVAQPRVQADSSGRYTSALNTHVQSNFSETPAGQPDSGWTKPTTCQSPCPWHLQKGMYHTDHTLSQCEAFQQSSDRDIRRAFMENGICASCLQTGHYMGTCSQDWTSANNCAHRHHPELACSLFDFLMDTNSH